jgi:hypothetical protein
MTVMHIPQELQIRIIKEATLLELLDVTTYKKNRQKLMFSLLVNSHCCCCGKTLSIFDRNYGSFTQRFFSPDWLPSFSDNGNPYYEGRFCSKYCMKRLIDYNEENGEYPPYHQVRSGSEGKGFFEMLNKKYSSVWNKETSLDLK